MKLKYLPEVDGLRTIAVMSVIIYHAQFNFREDFFLKGGFLGVDIFFVISGFLITSLILKEYSATGTFSVTHFYERRARRLLPALFTVMLVSLPFAWEYLLPTQLIDFSKSLVASLFFGSNIYWHYSLQEYGAESALLKPFLHTWSLAVEEQFYIIYPLIFIAIYRWCRKYVMVLIGAGLCLSLLFAEFITPRAASFSFYMLPTRFWELLAGCLLANIMVLYPRQHERSWLGVIMPVLGLFSILVPMFLIDHDARHPGFVTLFPVAGAAVIILFANEKDIVTRLLSNRLMTGIGLISYSLYLWHYPVFAFQRIIKPDYTLFDSLASILLVIGLSTATFFFIERPFRNKNAVPLRLLAATMLIIVTGVGTFSFYSIGNYGVRERFPVLAQIYGYNEFDNQILRKKSWNVLNNLAESKGFGPSTDDEPSIFESEQLWYSTDKTTEKILIVGDSHSNDLFNAFYLNKEDFDGYEFARFGMDNLIFPEQVATLLASKNFQNAETVIISFRYYLKNKDKLSALIDDIAAHSKRVILASNTVEFKKEDNEQLFDWYVKNLSGDFSIKELKSLFYENQNRQRGRINKTLRKIAKQKGITFLDKRGFICSDAERTCDGITRDGFKAFYDYGHWTIEGAQYFGKRISEISWLEADS